MIEPLYCCQCGAEDWNCDHSPSTEEYQNSSDYCEICGCKEPCGCIYSEKKEDQ